MLCRLPRACTPVRLWALALALVLATPLWAQGREQVLAQARQWAAPALGLEPARVAFAPLDERVPLQSCPQALQFDWPFAGRETLRVRCPQGWQVYLRVADPGLAAMGASVPNTAPTGASTAAAPVARKVLVAKRALARGTVLLPEHLEWASPGGPLGAGVPLDSLEAVQQAELLRDLPAGSPIWASDLRRALMVRQGQTAVLTIGRGQGFEIAVRVEAMQDGRMGEQIRLRNPESGRQISGVVTGPNALRGL